MAYYTSEQLSDMGFKSIGKNVKISDKASIYNHNQIEIGDHSRIDDFCVVSGKITIGRNVHITPMCLVAGGEKGIVIKDFVALAYGTQVFTQSDDYSGETMTNSTVPTRYKNESKKEIVIGKHSIIGAGSIIMPGVILAEGTSVGAMSLVRKSTEPWSIYVGNPAKKIKDRKKDLLKLEKEYLDNEGRVMIPFNKPPLTGNEERYVLESIKSGKISGDGEFTKKCHEWFEEKLACKKALLTTSCTHALEMAAILINIKEGDEVIMPSYTFVSTANAFVLRGAKAIFVDIRPDTMNIDETLIEAAITEKTKAIVPVHYAGVACEMDVIMDIANRHGLYVIEDAAQGMMSTYKGKQLGTIGHLGAYSFHETKNYTSAGEGGLLIINDEKFIQRAEIIREKGTNRSLFFRGMVDKYSWVDIGSSYLPSDMNAAFLWGQLERADDINTNRLASWNHYYSGLKELENKGLIELPIIPDGCVHNAHMFYLKVKDLEERTALLEYLKKNDILAVFHYVPLHSAPAGIKFGRFEVEDRYTTSESERLIRLPLFYSLKQSEINHVIKTILDFYAG
jgi:dTDP-4-amino-4,6-dideoxygalactose transaminase